METYRSGRNELDSKSSCPPGHVGSNPTVSAEALEDQGLFYLQYGKAFPNWDTYRMLCAAPCRLQ